MTEAERIVAELSEAQKLALLNATRRLIELSPTHARIEWHLLAYRDCGRLVASIQSLGLTKRGTEVLNQTGLAVRAHLERNDAE